MVKETRTTFTWPVCRELFSGSLKHLVNRRNCVAAIDDPVFYQLSGDNNLVSAITAILPFVKVHAVNPQHDRNTILALQYAAITVLEDLVNLRNPDRVQHHVCCVLNELAFQDSTRCFTPVDFPDLIEELSILLNPAAGQRQEVSVRTQFRSPSNPMDARISRHDHARPRRAPHCNRRHRLAFALRRLLHPIVAFDAFLRALSITLEDTGESERHAFPAAATPRPWRATLSSSNSPSSASSVAGSSSTRSASSIPSTSSPGALRTAPVRLVALGLLSRLALYFAAEVAAGAAAAAAP